MKTTLVTRKLVNDSKNNKFSNNNKYLWSVEPFSDGLHCRAASTQFK